MLKKNVRNVYRATFFPAIIVTIVGQQYAGQETSHKKFRWKSRMSRNVVVWHKCTR